MINVISNNEKMAVIRRFVEAEIAACDEHLEGCHRTVIAEWQARKIQAEVILRRMKDLNGER